MAQSRFTETAPAATDPSGEIHGIVGIAEPMLEVYRMVARVAPTTSTVLIQGETGTGKELIARAVHTASRRSDQPFVPVDCKRARGKPAGDRALRPYKGGLHRRRRGQAGTLRGGGGRDVLPR